MKSLDTQLPVSLFEKSSIRDGFTPQHKSLYEPEAVPPPAHNDVDHCGMYTFDCLQEHSVILCNYIPKLRFKKDFSYMKNEHMLPVRAD